MGIEEFPDIEDFHKLPRRVIVKGGMPDLSKTGSAEMSGIVINNTGQPIKNLQVNLVLFDRNSIPLVSTSTAPETTRLSQGGIASFRVTLSGIKKPVENYYLYSSWNYDDSAWN